MNKLLERLVVITFVLILISFIMMSATLGNQRQHDRWCNDLGYETYVETSTGQFCFGRSGEAVFMEVQYAN